VKEKAADAPLAPPIAQAVLADAREGCAHTPSPRGGDRRGQTSSSGLRSRL